MYLLLPVGQSWGLKPAALFCVAQGRTSMPSGTTGLPFSLLCS
jgi:hypothetical protein